MGSSKRCVLKTIIVLHIAFFLSYLPADSAIAVPTAEDINSLAEKARQTTDTFMQKTFQLRMSYEYGGKFLSQRDRENLNTLAISAGDQLLAIADNQRKLAKQIEDYQGDDWDDRYGSTGLWRKLSTDIYITNLAKCKIDYYLALTVEQSPLNKTLQDVRDQIILLDTAHSSANSQLLRAKILTLVRIDSVWRTLAIDILNLLMGRSSVPDAIYFRAAIERIKLFSIGKLEALNSLAHKLSQSSCNDDFELILSLAFLQRQYNPQGFEMTVQTWPQIEDFIGSLILSDLSNRITKGQLTEQYLQQISILEGELAAQAAWKNKTKEYQELLVRFSGTEKFQTPLILYVAAIALADSSPTKAVNLLITASRLQQRQKGDRLSIDAHEMAKQAAQLAYNYYTQDTGNCQLAIETFENYRTIAAQKDDEETEYLYAVILDGCGQAEKSRLLLEKMASRPAGSWRNRAKLDLITGAIQKSQSESQEKRSELLKQLDNLITNCRRNEDDKLLTEAITVYCRLLLQSKDKASAQKVLSVLTDAEITIDPNLCALKSIAFRHLGRLDESAECLAKICRTNNYEHVIEAEKLLLRIIDRFEQLRHGSADFAGLLKNSQTIARYCERISLTTYGLIPVGRARLYLAEILLFSVSKDWHKLPRIEKMLNDLTSNNRSDNVDLIRCRARLLTAQGKFTEAARLWAQIAKIRKNESWETTRQTWKWWRAKFYELDCFAKISQTKKHDILHTIEVLENSFTDIPPLWAEKLNLLKQWCLQSEK